MRTGMADLPLHGGKCPPWLFARMKRLGAAIIEVIVCEYGPEEVLRRLADPFWFQALGCVLGFDWHSSGLTTTVCGALKEGLRGKEKDLGLFVAGGKGRTSRQTPQEIVAHLERQGLAGGERLVYASRMAAKVDNSALQDGYQLYHHAFFFTASGAWAVVQQGMNEANGWARRYHWLGSEVTDFVCEPHAAICGQPGHPVLNMVAREGEASRRASLAVACEAPAKVLREYQAILAARPPSRLLRLGREHAVPQARHLSQVLEKTFAVRPRDYAALLGLPGVGPQTVRALALLAEVAWGAAPSFRDPVRYSFAHGGKDGHPFPVNRELYDRSIATLDDALKRARVGRSDKLDALRRLSSLKTFPGSK